MAAVHAAAPAAAAFAAARPALQPQPPRVAAAAAAARPAAAAWAVGRCGRGRGHHRSPCRRQTRVRPRARTLGRACGPPVVAWDQAWRIQAWGRGHPWAWACRGAGRCGRLLRAPRRGRRLRQGWDGAVDGEQEQPHRQACRGETAHEGWRRRAAGKHSLRHVKCRSLCSPHKQTLAHRGSTHPWARGWSGRRRHGRRLRRRRTGRGGRRRGGRRGRRGGR